MNLLNISSVKMLIQTSLIFLVFLEATVIIFHNLIYSLLEFQFKFSESNFNIERIQLFVQSKSDEN